MYGPGSDYAKVQDELDRRALAGETIKHYRGNEQGRVLTLLSKDTVTASGSVCEVKADDCVSCGACITACTYDAIEFIAEHGLSAKKDVQVDRQQ